jgi:hypothetical protein
MTHEISLNLDFKNNIQLGSFYRSNNRTGALLFVSISRFFDIGYAYELSIDKNLLNLGINNHEIFLRIRFDGLNKSEYTSDQSQEEDSET